MSPAYGEMPYGGRRTTSLPSCSTWRETITEGDRCPDCARKNLPDQFGEGSSFLQRVGMLLVCKNGHGPICTIKATKEDEE